MASVKLIKSLDKYLGTFVCLILSVFKTKKDVAVKKILLIQLWGLGETVLSLPAIKELRKKYTKSVIDIATTSRVNEVFYGNKDINDVKLIGLNPFSIAIFILRNSRKYDVAIDMEEYLNISSIIAFFSGKRTIGYSHGIRSLLYGKKVPYNDKQHVSQTFIDLLKPLGITKRVDALEKLNYSKKDESDVEKILKSEGIHKKRYNYS